MGFKWYNGYVVTSPQCELVHRNQLRVPMTDRELAYHKALKHGVSEGRIDGLIDVLGRVPNFSAAPGHAMQVLDKCLDQYAFPQFFKNPGCVAIEWENEREKFHRVEAQTLPLAICRFAKELFETETSQAHDEQGI